MIETTIVADSIGDDHIESLVLQLATRIVTHILRFRRETDRKRGVVEPCHGRQNILAADQFQRHRFLLLFDLLRRRFGGSIVGHGGGANEYINLADVAMCLGMHLFGRLHAMNLHTVRVFQVDGAADQYHAGALRRGRTSHRIPHLAGAAVRNVTHRIDRLACRAGRDEYGPPRKQSGRCVPTQVRGADCGRNVVGLEHAPGAGLTAGL